MLSNTAPSMTTATISRPITTQSSDTGSHAGNSELRQPADLSHISDEEFKAHIRRYERESVFINGLVSSVTIVPDHQSISGHGFVVVRVLVNGRPYTLIDWPRNEFYHHLCSLTERQRIGWIVTPIDWNKSKYYPFMRDHLGNPYSQFYRGSKIVDLDLYKKRIEQIDKTVKKIESQFKSYSRLLNGKTVSLPKGWARAQAIDECLDSASHRFKHVTNDPDSFFIEGI